MTRNLIAVPQLILLALFACAVALAVAVNLPPVKVMDQVHLDKHPEAGEVMRCEFLQGVYISWDKSMNCYKFELIKQLKDGRLCNQVSFPTDAGLLVKTAYAYAMGVGMDDLDKIMRSKGCTRIK
jgi:hypothetical protein